MVRSQALISYQHDGSEVTDEGMVVRSLSTSSRKGQAKAPHLNQPNIVTGVSAGVLSLCEFGGIGGELYVIYSESALDSSIDTTVVAALSPILQSDLLGGKLQLQPDWKEHLNKQKVGKIISSN